MFIKQVSVFIENTQGRLQSVLKVLEERKINIVSLSLADTSDYGMLRMIVSDANACKDALKDAGLSAHLTDVCAIKLPHTVGSLSKVLSILTDSKVGVEYMYALSTKDENACIVIKPSDKELCEKALKDNNLNFITEDEVENF